MNERLHRYVICFGALLLVALADRPAGAQGWTLDVYGGRATHQGALADVGAANAVMSLRHNADARWFHLSGAGPLAKGNPIWGAAGVGHELAWQGIGPLIGIDGGGSGYLFRDPETGLGGHGATVEVHPFLRLNRGASLVELRSGWAIHGGAVEGSGFRRSVWESAVSGTHRPAPAWSMSGEARYIRASEGGFPFLGASAAYGAGPAHLWISIGRWFADSLQAGVWGIGGEHGLTDRSTLWLALRQDASHPLYLSNGRRSWNVGFSRRLGRRPSTAVSVAIGDGRVVLRLPAQDADRERFVAGDFNDWTPIPMVRSGGDWIALLTIPSGVYSYAFRTEDGEWFVPESVQRRRSDGMGGFVAVLVVP